MATVVKDFKVKAGLVVEGSTATVNNYDVLTKNPADDAHIIGLVGGSADTANTPDTVVKRDANGDFAAGTITAETGFSGNLTGDVTGDVTGTVSDISNHTTDSLAEGTTNVYFTDARALSATSAAYDPAGSAATAEGNANTYTDGEILTLDGSLKAYADQAEADAKTYADGLASNYDAAGSASTAESNANSYTDSLIGDPTVDGTGGNTVTDRIATAVSNLVDSAPAALDTLNELAAALGDDANFVTTITTSIGEKVAKAGDTMTGALTLSGAPTADLHAATKKYVDDEIAATETYADGSVSTHSALTTGVHGVTGDVVGTTDTQTLTNKTIDGSSNTVSNIANASLVNDSVTVNGATVALGGSATIDTDAVGEGSTNLYFTDERAQDAVGAMLTGTQTNITVTYDDAAGTLSFVAENGVADSTTDDLTEGSTNLYFTDARAVSALEAVVPNFTEVDINSVATQVAATQTVATASQVVAYSFDSGSYRSAKFLVKVKNGTHSEVSEVLVTLDSSNNIAITEYAVVGTNGSMSTVTAGMNGTDVELLVTTVNNSSDVTVMGTLLV